MTTEQSLSDLEDKRKKYDLALLWKIASLIDEARKDEREEVMKDVRLAVQKLKENIVSRFNNDANVVMNWEFILNEEIDKIFGSKLIQ